MAKTGLPRETPAAHLDFSRLVAILDLIEGDSVVVRFSTRGVSGEPLSQLASIVGELRHQSSARYEDHEFSIGSPYPDRGPEHLAGGVLFLSEDAFESATLTTFDGNDYFVIDIKTRLVEILIEGIDGAYP